MLLHFGKIEIIISHSSLFSLFDYIDLIVEMVASCIYMLVLSRGGEDLLGATGHANIWYN